MARGRAIENGRRATGPGPAKRPKRVSPVAFLRRGSLDFVRRQKPYPLFLSIKRIVETRRIADGSRRAEFFPAGLRAASHPAGL